MINSPDFIYSYVLIPFLIFIARISDVTIGTLRIVFVSKGYKILAPLFGFFEVLIWLIAMSKIMQNLDNWVYYIAYASGFAAGNYVGLILEEKIALGHINLRIITKKDGSKLIKRLSAEGYGVTQIEATGSRGKVHIIYCTIKRKEYKDVIPIIFDYNPKAFYTIEDVRFSNREGTSYKFTQKKNFLSLFRIGK
ncbi:MAG: DUF2179 domain-containing protein [Marinilabiliaceae bacterium]|nr:DUF2179 domain-containing protein [Marinilabiliaceae bacterium]